MENFDGGGGVFCAKDGWHYQVIVSSGSPPSPIVPVTEAQTKGIGSLMRLLLDRTTG